MRHTTIWSVAAATAAIAGAAAAQTDIPPDYFYSETPLYMTAPAGAVARARASEDAEIIAELPPGAGAIEAAYDPIAGGPGWMRVLAGEGVAWVRRDVLSEIDVERLGRSAVPVGAICLGTEPFWSITLDEQSEATALWAWTLGDEERLAIEQTVLARGRLGAPAAVLLEGGAVLTIAPAACSDGMSDRLYPWSATVLTQDAGDAALLDGCCYYPDAFDR